MKNQTLSSLLDGELTPDELEQALDRILADQDLQSSWHTQHILRAVIQDNYTQACCQIVDKVAAVVADEPAIVAPDNLKPMKSERAVPQNVVAIRSNRNKVLAYAAIAASFAAIVVVSYSPDKVSSPRLADATNTGTALLTIAAEQELQSMIVQHGEFSGAAALNGLVAYAQVVNGTTAGRAR